MPQDYYAVPNISFDEAIVYSITKFGGRGDGKFDNTNAISYASQVINAEGGGYLFLPPGVYLTTPQSLFNNVVFVGNGRNNTTIQLINGSNGDLFSGQINQINLSAASGVGPIGTLFNFGFMHLTLDGNLANQSGTSYPLRFYGYSYILHDVIIKNGLSGGILSDWNGGGGPITPDDMEAQVSNIKVHNNNGIGII